MQGRNTIGQAKTEQTQEAETTEQEHKEENFEIEKQKLYQKLLDSSNTSDREENNSEIQRLNVHTEQIKETDDIIIYLIKYWQTATKEGNGPNIKDRTSDSYNNGELNHTANNHNKSIDKESKVETQESKLVHKETFNVNIPTSHIEQYKYPHNTNVSSEPFID